MPLSFSAIKLSRDVTLQLVSIFVPGVLICTEVTAIISPRKLSQLGSLELNGLATTYWVFIALAVSYAAGLLLGPLASHWALGGCVAGQAAGHLALRKCSNIAKNT